MDDEAKQRPRKRQATLFDAVAGRVGYEGFLRNPTASRYGDTRDTSNRPVPPDEVLFRLKNAPDRFAENDAYRADRHLDGSQQLPDSELLKRIQAYVSDYYAKTNPDHNQRDFRSMDETALIAFGVLIEEAASRALGETGDLAFVRAPDEADMRGSVLHKVPATRHVPLIGTLGRRQRQAPPSVKSEWPTTP